ncbi:hypothetical protein D1007_28769 [Hordeum vulgare]|nr:hypothetical protein D1007_28769 [Hordeum vulgare]
MEDPMLSPVTVEVAHAPSPRADLVAGHVAPAVIAQAHAVPSRKRQGTVVVQGGKAGKAAAVKRRKVPALRKPPYSTSDFTPPPLSRKELLRRCR